MPVNPVINRRGLTSLKRRSLLASDKAAKATAALAARLHVSQGSLVDTALLVLTAQPPERVAQLLHAHRHLTDDELTYVLDLLAAEAEAEADADGGDDDAKDPKGA